MSATDSVVLHGSYQWPTKEVLTLQHPDVTKSQ